MNKKVRYLLITLVLISSTVDASFGPFSSAGQHPVQPRLKSTTKLYTPTNSWYENLLLGKGASAIQTYPYQVKAKQEGFCISYSGKSVNQQYFVIEGYLDNLILSINEGLEASMIDKSTVKYSTIAPHIT